MGLYEDIQTGIKEAFEGDLKDAVRIIQYIEMISTYDPDTMENVLTPNPKDVIAVKIEDTEGENLDNPSLNDSAKFLIMDEDRINSNIIFIIGIKIIDGNNSYKIKGIDLDPAGCSWELECRRWG